MKKLLAFPLLFIFLCSGSVFAEPVAHRVTRCEVAPVPLGGGWTDFTIERCAPDVTENAFWHVDRSDSTSGDLNGRAIHRTSGRGSMVYVIDAGVLRRHDEFTRSDGTNAVIGGFDAHEASGAGRSPCPNFALEPCYSIPPHRGRHGHGTAVASVVAGRHSGIAPDALLYSATIHPTFPGLHEIRMWHVALDHIIRHAWSPAAPEFQTAVVTISIPATPLPHEPLYRELVEKVRAMTHGVDAEGKRDANGKRFLFTVAAGNIVPGADFCSTFPAILGPVTEGVIAVGGIGRDDLWWGGSCRSLAEVVAPADSVLVASISGSNRFWTMSGTSFAAPYVAGLAARHLELDPTLSPAELERLIRRTPSYADDSALPIPILTVGDEQRR
jgi:Subtilase family